MTLKCEKCVMPFVLWINLDIDISRITQKWQTCESLPFLFRCRALRLGRRLVAHEHEVQTVEHVDLCRSVVEVEEQKVDVWIFLLHLLLDALAYDVVCDTSEWMHTTLLMPCLANPAISPGMSQPSPYWLSRLTDFSASFASSLTLSNLR